MQLSFRLHGMDEARARLAAIGRNVGPVIRGTLNTTASKTRAERYVKPLSGSVGRRAWLNARIKIKRANSRRTNARLIPSSSGIPVTQMKSWGFDPIGPTSARVWVRGPDGRKVAAGFVNPAGKGKMPLSTRSEKARRLKQPARARNPQIASYRYGRDIGEAMAPSVAYWFKALSSGETMMWVNAFMQQEFERRIQRDIDKGPR